MSTKQGLRLVCLEGAVWITVAVLMEAAFGSDEHAKARAAVYLMLGAIGVGMIVALAVANLRWRSRRGPG